MEEINEHRKIVQRRVIQKKLLFWLGNILWHESCLKGVLRRQNLRQETKGMYLLLKLAETCHCKHVQYCSESHRTDSSEAGLECWRPTQGLNNLVWILCYFYHNSWKCICYNHLHLFVSVLTVLVKTFKKNMFPRLRNIGHMLQDRWVMLSISGFTCLIFFLLPIWLDLAAEAVVFLLWIHLDTKWNSWPPSQQASFLATGLWFG